MEPAEKDTAEPETGESLVWDQGVLGQRGKDWGWGHSEYLFGLKFFIHPGDEWVPNPWISQAGERA